MIKARIRLPKAYVNRFTIEIERLNFGSIKNKCNLVLFFFFFLLVRNKKHIANTNAISEIELDHSPK